MTELARRPLALIAAALVLLSIPADVISWILAPGYDPIGNTISDLAVGPASWLSDLGLWSFGLGCMFLGVALGLLPGREAARELAAAGIFAVGYASAAIAPLREYAGQANPGADVHQWCVYALGLLLPLSAFAGSRMEAFRDRGTRVAGLAIGVVWLVLAPIFLFVPTGFDGAVERGLALLMIAWALVLASAPLRAPDPRRGPARGPVGGRLMRV
jgi:hypothetical protein